jgi:long-subunit acyl-CoA synthetase (AMP-forming)
MILSKRRRARETMSHARAPCAGTSSLAPFDWRTRAGWSSRPCLALRERRVRERRDGRLETVTWINCSDVVAFGRFLRAGVGPESAWPSSSANRGEMLVAELATMGIGAIYTPIFAGYAADQLRTGERRRASALLLAGRAARAGRAASARTS